MVRFGRFSLFCYCFCWSSMVLAEGIELPASLVPPGEIATYEAFLTSDRPEIDGELDESVLAGGDQERVIRRFGPGAPTRYRTEGAIRWDHEFLYVAFWIEEPNVRASIQASRDAPIYRDNDIELFLACKNAYYEFEMNAHGTIYEGLFIWRDVYERLGYAKEPGLGRGDRGVQGFRGVGFRNHPRGRRVACLAWDFPQLQSAVAIDGTLNDDTDADRGWTAELAIPWSGMDLLLRGDERSVPPETGDVWRIQLFRFNRERADPPPKDSGGWAINRHGVYDSHIPEVFPRVVFSE